jgi:DNA-binding response OmpR family regulator
VPRRARTTPNTSDTGQRRRKPRPFRVLVVDADPHVQQVVDEALAGDVALRFHAVSLDDARRILKGGPVDMAVVSEELPDGSGMDLLATLQQQKQPAQTIFLAHKRNFDTVVKAMRLGAADVLLKPLKLDEVKQCVTLAVERYQVDHRKDQRLRRLQRICTKLNTARHEITRQVDALCNDLVGAYQELANQMQHVVQTSEFVASIRHELDLEQLLRKSLEHVLDKCGPTNAAIFLPSTMDEFSLGGYINYDQTGGSPDMLLQHLADVVAPKAAERQTLAHITDDETLSGWIGDDAAYLTDCHVLAAPCRHDDECLAVLVLFRDAAQPFEVAGVEAINAMSPVLAEYLAKIIRVHHRMAMHHEFEGPDEPTPF